MRALGERLHQRVERAGARRRIRQEQRPQRFVDRHEIPPEHRAVLPGEHRLDSPRQAPRQRLERDRRHAEAVRRVPPEPAQRLGREHAPPGVVLRERARDHRGRQRGDDERADEPQPVLADQHALCAHIPVVQRRSQPRERRRELRDHGQHLADLHRLAPRAPRVEHAAQRQRDGERLDGEHELPLAVRVDQPRQELVPDADRRREALPHGVPLAPARQQLRRDERQHHRRFRLLIVRAVARRQRVRADALGDLPALGEDVPARRSAGRVGPSLARDHRHLADVREHGGAARAADRRALSERALAKRTFHRKGAKLARATRARRAGRAFGRLRARRHGHRGV